MRVSMKKLAYVTPCETLSSGEVEDYTVNIVATGKTDDLPQNAQIVLMYPNPASEKVYFNWGNMAGKVKMLVLYNAIGQKIAEIKADNNGNIADNLSLKGLSDGIYLVSIQTNSGEVISKRLIVSNTGK